MKEPDLSFYTVESLAPIGQCTVVAVKYHNATNYEGKKILVYIGQPPDKLDPHFCDKHKSPIARFEPTERGWMLAKHLASTVSFSA